MNVLAQAGIDFALAALLSAGITALCIHLSRRLHLIADPRADRWHKVPTPNTGGAAIFLSCAAIYLIVGKWQYPVVAGAAAAMFALGFIDDRLRLRPRIKFLGQSLAAIAVIASGVVFRPTPWEPLNLFITFLWITGITNAFNLIDNMDGLCAGVTVIIAGSRFWLAIQNGDHTSAGLLAIIAGAFFGFLIFNYNPARIFMGDTGSMFAGFTLASLAIAAPVPNTRIFISTILAPALTFLYPIFDTALVSFLRRATGKPISQGGRDHSSHRLVSLGIGERKAVWLLWTLAAAGSAAGLLTYWMPVGVLAIGFLLLLATIIFGIFLAGLPGYELLESGPAHLSWIRRLIPSLRAGITLIVDVLLAGVALLAAFLLRWEDSFIGVPLSEFRLSLPVVLGCQLFACLVFRTFNLGWRWSGSRDLVTIAQTVVFSASTSIFAVWMGGLRGYSRGVIVIYALLLFLSMGALRASLRLLWHTLALPQAQRKVALLAASSSIEFLVLALRHHAIHDMSPVVILGTDPAAENTRMYGVPVRYAVDNPAAILESASADSLLILANDELTLDQERIVQACAASGISVEQFEITVRPYEDRTSATAAN